MKFVRFLYLIFLFCCCGVLNAQKIDIKSTIDTNQLLIGDQILFSIKITVPNNTNLTFPIYTDTIIKGIEVVENRKIDTISQQNGLITMQHDVVITSFDTGVYMLPSGPFVLDSSDTVFGQNVFLAVNTFEIDTTKGIADIKMPYDAPISFDEVLPIILWVLLGLAIVALILFIIYKLNSKQKVIEYIERKVSMEPAHIVALRDLDILKTEKLWEQNKVKEYYSRLTEIIRIYIEYRFEISALEQTTDEIINDFKRIGYIEPNILLKLEKTFRQADLVKFAKLIPPATDNENNFNIMYDFVLKTKSTTNQVSNPENMEA